jgi:hypothetical protein
MASLLIAGLYSCSSGSSHEETLLSYLESHNKHDIEAAMEYFHPDARIIMPGRPVLREIRKLEAWDAAIKSKQFFDSYEVNGDTIRVGKIVEKNNWFSRGGIEQVVYEPGTLYIFREGKIFEVRITEMTPESQEAIGQMYGQFLDWAYQNRRPEISRLMPGGEFAFDQSNAKECFLLLDEWQTSKH